MPVTLLSPRLKLERAREHIEALDTGFRAYTNRHPHRLTNELDDDGWNIVCIEIIRPIPESLSLIAGDAAHCIRSALDHIVYAVSTGSTNAKRRGYWPICVTEGEYLRPRGKAPCERPSMRDEGLASVPEPIRAIIDTTQPYLGGNRASEHVFAVISRLDNADKHRVVQPAIAVVKDAGTIEAARATPGNPVTLREEWFDFGRPLSLEEKTKVLRWRTEPALAADEVSMKLNPSLTIVFGEGGNFDQVMRAYGEIYKLIDLIETTEV